MQKRLKQTFLKNKVFSILFTGILFLTVYLCFYRLGSSPLDNWDEAWYAAITKHMVLTHEFIKQYWNNNLSLDKPPLYMWLSSLFGFLFGLSEFSIRLTSAVSGFTIIIIATVYSYRKYGLIPSLATFSSIALNNIFIWRTRSGNLDAFTALLIFITYFVMIGKAKYRLPLLGFIFACIYLTRASYVLFPFSIFLLHETVFRWRDFSKNVIEYTTGISIFFFLCGAWLFAGFKEMGSVFTNYYFFHSDRGNLDFALRNFKLDYIQYAYYSLQRRFFYVFLLGLILLLRKIKEAEYFLQFLFSVVLLVFLSFIGHKNNWYLIPLTPFWGLVIGYGVYKVILFFRKNRLIQLGVFLLILLISYKTFTVNITPILYTVSAIGEATSGKYLKAHTKKTEIIVRLDSNYPTFIYYSDRKVYVSPVDTDVTDTANITYINRKNLMHLIKNNTIHWLAGDERAVDYFTQTNSDLKYKIIRINNDELIAEVLPGN